MQYEQLSVHSEIANQSCNYGSIKYNSCDAYSVIPTLFFRATDAPLLSSSSTMFFLSSSQAIISGEWQRYLSGISIPCTCICVNKTGSIHVYSVPEKLLILVVLYTLWLEANNFLCVQYVRVVILHNNIMVVLSAISKARVNDIMYSC